MNRRVPWILATLLCLCGGYLLWAQTVTFNTVVVTSQGQFINARLGDNVYLDMTTSPPMLRAKRPILHVKPVRQADESWIIPQNLPVGPMMVMLNGLEGYENVDYKIDPANKHRLIPFRDKEPTVPVKWVDEQTGEPWSVVVHIFQ